MSMEYWFKARLEFADKAAIKAARKELAEEGYQDHEDNLLCESELKWSGTVLEVDARGSMPYSCFEISSDVLRLYAQHATGGEALAINIEDGCGERHLAGGEEEELADEEVDALRKEYGWQEPG
ncbi:MAG: hypothetical protein GYA21_15075 [Myxococcales bacterium]|nr:hypothetical protein [Myxococcales bacterium]